MIQRWKPLHTDQLVAAMVVQLDVQWVVRAVVRAVVQAAVQAVADTRQEGCHLCHQK